MRVVSFLADSVVVAEGKMYVQGAGWDTIATAQLPTRHSRLGIGTLIRVPYGETNIQHRFEIRVEDPDGKEVSLGEAPPGTPSADKKIHRIGSAFVIGRPPTVSAGDEQILPIAANLDGLLFEAAGTYRVVIAIDGEDVESLPFRLTVMAQVGPLVR